jgi:microcystin-dependent protein
MSLPALPVAADTRSITERVNVLIRDYNTLLPVPAGCVMPFAGAAPPDGWLLCYGQAVSRTAYSDLFTAIGTTYGAGDGSTTFNLPDLRGRVAAGKDDMGGSAAGRLTAPISGATLGAFGGEQSHILSTTEMPAHSHSFGIGQHDAAIYNGNVNGGDGTNQTTFNSSSVGGGGAHNNVQPTIVLNHIIST